MMIEIAAGMANAAALVAIQMRKDGTSADDIHKHALELITDGAAAMRERGLEKLRTLGARGV